ncbi:MAG: WG repeat-containing protein [Ferruginibacter sp.]
MKSSLFLMLLISSMCYGQDRLKGTYNAEKKIFTVETGQLINDFRHGLSAYRDYSSDLMGLIDTSGRIIMKPRYYEIEGFGGGLSRVTMKAEPWELTYGFIDTLGNEILPPIYDDADTWYYRSLRFANVLVVAKDKKYGLFDYTGKKLTPLKYQSIWDFREELVRVYLDDKAGYVTKEGKEIIPTIYEEAHDFGAGIALVKKEGKYGWIDQKGQTVIPFNYDWAMNFGGGWAKVKLNGKMIYIDRNGNPKLPMTFDGVGYYRYGLAWAHKNGKWGFIDSLGTVVIPLIYTKTGNFEKGRAWVWKDTKWGHIDTKGNITTPIIYESASDFSNSYNGDSLFASVQLNGQYGKVGINGQLAIPCKYAGIDHFSMGLAKVKKQIDDSYRFGFVNYQGEEIIPCKYDKAERFIQGRRVTIVYLNGLAGLINLAGKEITPITFHDIQDLKNGTFQVREASVHYIIDEDGKRIEK